ncbi:MAG: NUDIX domain-containing protein [Candidatus Poseidoniaceae archaeon]|nr:NUDIX domain-containing protein [Candidatus Poseidoniaceae archaeon]
MHTVECDLGVAAIVRRSRSVLLVREAHGRYKGCWGLPKGYVNKNELPSHAVVRELSEECEVDGQIIGVQSIRERLVDGTPAIFIAYLVEIDDEQNPSVGEEVTESRFIDAGDFDSLEWISDAMHSMALSAVNSNQALRTIDYEHSRGHPYMLHTLPKNWGGEA